MSIELSPDQAKAFEALTSWYAARKAGTGPQTMTMGGYGGTGKTTILNNYCQHLVATYPGIRVAVVSFTGKAVDVLRKKIKAPVSISTIHSLMYEATETSWKRRKTLPVDIIVNDEGSMTNAAIYKDMLSYNVPILVVGDHGQLPPIGDTFNLMENPMVRLEKIHRQAEGNPIIQLSQEIRHTGKISLGKHGASVVVALKGTAEADEILSRALLAEDDSMIITATNAARGGLNRDIVQTKAGVRFKDHPFDGARVICLRNNNQIGVFNGQQFTVKSTEARGKDKIAYLVDDAGDTTRVYMATDGFFAYSTPKYRRHQQTVPFDYGYALTCHKAQGSQARRVFVLGSGFGEDDMRRRWLYTAVTRAEEELYVVL